MSQNAQILHYMKMGRRLTPLAALRLFGYLRLAARVFELREQGHSIISEPLTVRGKRFMAYRIAP